MHKDTCGRLKELCPEDLGFLIRYVADRTATLVQRNGKRPNDAELDELVNAELDKMELMAHQAEHGLE